MKRDPGGGVRKIEISYKQLKFAMDEKEMGIRPTTR